MYARIFSTAGGGEWTTGGTICVKSGTGDPNVLLRARCVVQSVSASIEDLIGVRGLLPCEPASGRSLALLVGTAGLYLWIGFDRVQYLTVSGLGSALR